MMKPCPKCQTRIKITTAICQNCGEQYPHIDPRGCFITAIASFFGFSIFLAISFMIGFIEASSLAAYLMLIKYLVLKIKEERSNDL